MRTRFVSLLVGSFLATAGLLVANPTPEWKRLLEIQLVDEWQPIFGTCLHHLARPAETLARKFAVLNQVIAKSTGGKMVPIYLSVEAATTECPTINDTRGQLIQGVELHHVPIIDVLRYITDINGFKTTVTDYGILVEVAPQRVNTAPNP